MSPQPWWKVWPGRLEWELEKLGKAGIEYRRDEKAFSEGVLCLCLSVAVGGERLDLQAVFPDLYPYFKFEVIAPSLSLSHHQNPLTKNLCFIGRSTELWNPDDSLASFLTQRLPDVLDTGRSADSREVADREQHQAEPFSDYHHYESGSAVIVSGDWSIDVCHTSGTLLIGLQSESVYLLRGAVLKVFDDNRKLLAATAPRLQAAFEGGPLQARWVRLKEAPILQTPKELYNHLRDQDTNRNLESHSVNGGKLRVRAGLFPEELRSWRKQEQGWLFACRFTPKNELRKRPRKKRGKRRK